MLPSTKSYWPRLMISIRYKRLSLPQSERYQVRLKLHSKGTEPMLLVHNVDIPWVSVVPIGKAQISTEGIGRRST